MIIATAGHVDHGKTLLVKALTGVDADRLPEEKKRGMTIDLGFAYLPMESGEPIGFIDVPGHERFVHNMLCGVAGIDFVLFIIAADDGPMPQTTEHLSILDLLDVPNGAVALTKVDRVAPSRVNEIQGEIAALLAGTALEGAPVFPVSAVTGEGIAELKNHLVRTARDCPPRTASGNFRLAIDRCFSIAGAGLVVTGTAVSGTVAVGDQIRILEAKLSARIRTIHAQNTPLASGRAGQRCALNLTGAGLKHDLIKRGDWVVTGSVPEPISKIDARLRILKSEQEPLTHWTPVHVHVAAADVTGRVAVLEGSSIAPGASALVQLVLDRPMGALRGDGFIIRDQSAQRTIGGGRVIDIFSPARGRAKSERLAYLTAMEDSDDQTALTSLVDAAPNGLNLSRFAANRNLTSEEINQLIARSSLRVVATSTGHLAFSQAQWDKLKAIALQTLAASHRHAPDTMGLSENSILGTFSLGAPGNALPSEVAHQVAAELLREKAVVKEASGVRLPSHLPKLDSGDAALWQKVAPLLEQNPLRPPAVHEIAVAIGQDPKKTESFLVRASRLGLVVRVSVNRFFRPEALNRLSKIAETIAADSKDHTVTAAAFRDCTKIGRTLAIEVLEYFDRIKFTRRVGDTHQIIRLAGDRAT
jgi:selenocysteine-specific elongation factor